MPESEISSKNASCSKFVLEKNLAGVRIMGTDVSKSELPSPSSRHRKSTNETHIVIPRPLLVSKSSILNDEVVFLVASFSSSTYGFSSTCKKFHDFTLFIRIFQCMKNVDDDITSLRKLLKRFGKPFNDDTSLNLFEGANILHVATTSGRPEVLELLLDYFGSPTRMIDFFDTQCHRTPLHVASSRGSKSMVRTLLEKGANPNLLDREGNSALHLSSSLSSSSGIIFDDLIRHGADVNLRNMNGDHVSHLVCLRCEKNASSLLGLLKSSGAVSTTFFLF